MVHIHFHALIIADELSHLCIVLSHRLRRKEPPIADRRAIIIESKVQLNYHIQVDRMYYSVPYDYVREDVDIRLTADLIEVYFKEVRIASHKRLKGEIGEFFTNPNHMPDNHRLYLEHNPENNRKWAETIGPSIAQFVSYILEMNVEKKALNILSTLRNIATKYTNEEIEKATETLLEISTKPTVSVLKSVLERNKKKKQNKKTDISSNHTTSDDYGFVRGAKYLVQGE